MTEQQPWTGVADAGSASGDSVDFPPPWRSFRAEDYRPIPEQRSPQTPYATPQPVAPQPVAPPPWQSQQPSPAWQSQPPSPPSRYGTPVPAAPAARTNGVLVAISIVSVVLLVAGGVGAYIWYRSQQSSAAAAGTPALQEANGQDGAATGGLPGGATTAPSMAAPSVPRSVPSSSAPGGLSPEQAALGQLTAMRAGSVSRVPLDGRWVAQVASKWVGITDPLQTAANGSHTFQAADILTETRQAQSAVGDPSRVFVLWGTDFGKRSTAPDGSPIWVTVVDGGFGSADDVQHWCQATYSSLTPEQLADSCAARTLNPPHD